MTRFFISFLIYEFQKNKIKQDSGYKGVSNVKRDDSGNNIFDSDFISDDDAKLIRQFIEKIKKRLYP